MTESPPTPGDTPLPVPTEQGASTVRELFEEIDREREAAGGSFPTRTPGEAPKPVAFPTRRVLKPAGTAAAPGAAAARATGVSEAMSYAAEAALHDPVVVDPALPYPQWLRAVEMKYRTLLRVRSTPDFIDIDRLNTVIAEFPAIFAEVTREAREAKDAAEDAKESFDIWWDGKIAEARGLAAAESQKITSDTGLLTFARAKFSDSYVRKHEPVKEAQRRAEFLGSMKLVVEESGKTLKFLPSSAAFEWSTAGGLKFEDAGKAYFGLPARRSGDRPSPHALMEASRRRGAQTT